MELLILLVVMALSAWLNVYLAQQRGRNEVGWAIGALLFGFLSTLLLLVLGTTEEKKREDIKKAIDSYRH